MRKTCDFRMSFWYTAGIGVNFETCCHLCPCLDRESHLATDNELVRNILLATMSSLAKVEAEKISERVKAGLQRAVAKGKKLGRKPVAPEIEAQVRKMRADGIGMLKIAEKLGIGSSTVQRIVREAHG
jgi:DNA invertase Pin-like site-specific DNA recombinase